MTSTTGSPSTELQPAGPSADRLVSIDILRGIAVLLVVIRHLPFSLRLTPDEGPAVSTLPNWATELTHYGEYGVHLFLVISGFCIHLRWARRADVDEKIPFLGFWRRRLMRLYPPYAVTLVLSLAFLFIGFGVLGGRHNFPQAFGYSDTSLFVTDLILLLLLLQNLNGASQRVGNGPFWSLALEEQLYLLYFPLLWLRRKYGWTAALSVAFVTSLTWRILGVTLFEQPPEYWTVVGPALWFDWTLGALAVEAHFGHVKLPAWCSKAPLVFVFFGLALWTDPPPSWGTPSTVGVVLRDIVFGLGFFVWVNSACLSERQKTHRSSILSRAVERIGIWSYSIYLTHNPLMVAVKQVGVRLGFPMLVILGMRFAISILFGVVFHRLVEVPFIKAARDARRKAGS